MTNIMPQKNALVIKRLQITQFFGFEMILRGDKEIR